MTTVRDVPTVLARHGVDPGADAGTLAAALADRGWEAAVEEVAISPGTAPRHRALARRSGEGAFPVHRQAYGRTAAAALGLVLAKVLDQGR